MNWTRPLIIEELKSILVSADERKRDILDSVTEDSTLTEDLGLSSIGILYIVIAVEETFKIRFDNISAGDFATLREVVDYIEKKLK